MESQTPIIIASAGNGYIVSPAEAGTTAAAATGMLVFESSRSLLKFIEQHFSATPRAPRQRRRSKVVAPVNPVALTQP
jgi:hypothetical protein